VLLFPEGILELNPTALAILARCDGKTTVESVIAALAEEYDVAAEELQGDVLEYLRELQQRRLLILC
jgi:pyrroloquinoline quinone biosynthesis protein D